jgi:hypothetical protein
LCCRADVPSWTVPCAKVADVEHLLPSLLEMDLATLDVVLSDCRRRRRHGSGLVDLKLNQGQDISDCANCVQLAISELNPEIVLQHRFKQVEAC